MVWRQEYTFTPDGTTLARQNMHTYVSYDAADKSNGDTVIRETSAYYVCHDCTRLMPPLSDYRKLLLGKSHLVECVRAF